MSFLFQRIINDVGASNIVTKPKKERQPPLFFNMLYLYFI